MNLQHIKTTRLSWYFTVGFSASEAAFTTYSLSKTCTGEALTPEVCHCRSCLSSLVLPLEGAHAPLLVSPDIAELTAVFCRLLNPDTKYRGVNSTLPDFVHKLHTKSRRAFTGCGPWCSGLGVPVAVPHNRKESVQSAPVISVTISLSLSCWCDLRTAIRVEPQQPFVEIRPVFRAGEAEWHRWERWGKIKWKSMAPPSLLRWLNSNRKSKISEEWRSSSLKCSWHAEPASSAWKSLYFSWVEPSVNPEPERKQTASFGLSRARHTNWWQRLLGLQPLWPEKLGTGLSEQVLTLALTSGRWDSSCPT